MYCVLLNKIERCAVVVIKSVESDDSLEIDSLDSRVMRTNDLSLVNSCANLNK